MTTKGKKSKSKSRSRLDSKSNNKANPKVKKKTQNSKNKKYNHKKQKSQKNKKSNQKGGEVIPTINIREGDTNDELKLSNFLEENGPGNPPDDCVIM